MVSGAGGCLPDGHGYPIIWVDDIAGLSKEIREAQGLPTSKTVPHEGVVCKIDEWGLGIVEDTTSHEQFTFTFDRIKDYGGQRPGEFGLFVGSQVRFRSSAASQVTDLELVSL